MIKLARSVTFELNSANVRGGRCLKSFGFTNQTFFGCFTLPFSTNYSRVWVLSSSSHVANGAGEYHQCSQRGVWGVSSVLPVGAWEASNWWQEVTGRGVEA